MKKKIGLLGGAFNPITNKGHVSLALFVLEEISELDEIWVMPCFGHADKKELVSSEHRVKMCKLAFQDFKRLKVFDYEIEHQLNGSTYDMLSLLSKDEEYTDYEFFFIMGQDNANTLHLWDHSKELMEQYNFIVVHRKGYDNEASWYHENGHIYINKEFAEIPVSSTMVRNLLSKETLDEMEKSLLESIVDDKVLDYIKKNGLY